MGHEGAHSDLRARPVAGLFIEAQDNQGTEFTETVHSLRCVLRALWLSLLQFRINISAIGTNIHSWSRPDCMDRFGTSAHQIAATVRYFSSGVSQAELCVAARTCGGDNLSWVRRSRSFQEVQHAHVAEQNLVRGNINVGRHGGGSAGKTSSLDTHRRRRLVGGASR